MPNILNTLKDNEVMLRSPRRKKKDKSIPGIYNLDDLARAIQVYCHNTYPDLPRITLARIRAIIQFALDGISFSIDEGIDVNFVGFGHFYLKHYPERYSHNMHSGERFYVPPYKAVKFKASKRMRNFINSDIKAFDENQKILEELFDEDQELDEKETKE